MKQFENIYDKLMIAIDESDRQQFGHLPMVYYEGKLWVDATEWINLECAPLRAIDVNLKTKEWVDVDGKYAQVDVTNPSLTIELANDSWTPEMASMFSQVFGDYEVQVYEEWDAEGPTGQYGLKVITKL